MNKTQIIKHVVSSTKVDESTVRIVFNSIIETIQDKLFFGLDIKIKGFMNLTLRENPASKRHNPQNMKTIELPKRYSIKVAISRTFKERIATKEIY